MTRSIRRVNELITVKETGRRGVFMSNDTKEARSKFIIYAVLCILAVLLIDMHGVYAAAFEADKFAAGIGKSVGKAVVSVMWLGLGVICTAALILTPGDFTVKGASGLGLGMLGGAGLSQIQDRFLSDEMLASAFDALPILQGVVSHIS